MHTYDQTRHIWRYDVGGYAWDNGELGKYRSSEPYELHLTDAPGTDLWLWMSFLRTGRADVFRIASAMTRHLSETDFHHTGTYAGLGSRHNVSHWGDGAKEARVGAAALKRPFYYLTSKWPCFLNEATLLDIVHSGRADGRHYGCGTSSWRYYHDLGSAEKSVTSQ